METMKLFMYTESSLHAGTGSSVSVVDLPIQRERTTQYPMIQGSGVKGALRAQANLSSDDAFVVFGPDTNGASDHAGALSAGDARIVLFPVRSLAGVFAYTTSALALARMAREIGSSFPQVALEESDALITQQSDLKAGGRVVLEEFSFNAKSSAEVTDVAKWLAENAFPADDSYAYWRSKVMSSLIVLPENAFRDFTVNATEIRTHVRLDPAKKTVAEGALWTTESLPSDVLMYSPVTFRGARKANDNRSASDLAALTQDSVGSRIQIGGDETTGQGIVALRWF
jgi:CRISPR-associated protein Cmr4